MHFKHTIDRILTSFNLQRVIDYTTYFLNLSKANLERDPEWELLYSAKVLPVLVVVTTFLLSLITFNFWEHPPISGCYFLPEILH